MANISGVNVLAFLLIIFYLSNIKCDSDNCNFGTCGECISYAQDNDNNCVWCSQDEFHERRCQSNSFVKTKKDWCKKEFIVNPQPAMKIIKDHNFNETIDKHQVQIKPQLIKMKARSGVAMKFNISYKPAKDFPIDVYYLMDVSFTMKLQMELLMQQAQKIYKDLKGYTNNVRFGVGSFIDKPGFPFVNLANKRHESHAFVNHVSLTENMTLFETIIKNITFGSNYDDPEAGLDGLMQAMACEDEIGWRKEARRIILLCTDSTYHSAGDGKIIGAIKPHDMQCHLKNNTYTMALTYDYPSVSQINKIALEKNFKIIFAITTNMNTRYLPEQEYQVLAKQIIGAKYAKLEGGTGVLKIIKEVYEEAARTVKLHIDAPPFIQLDIDQDCNSVPTRNCETTHSQPIVTIPGNLIIKSCPTDNKLKHQVKVIPIGLYENLIIDLEMDCKCDCENGVGPPSPKCHEAGVLQCGICKCNRGRYGVDCRCNGTSTDKKDTEKCKLNADDFKLCSGRGQCRCGKCEECQIGFSGEFCEFDDNSCPRPNNQLCFGKGICRRGRCECDANWSGEDCSCPLHNFDCFAPYSKEVCSGNGECHCGGCICKKLEGKNETYSGKFCDDCEECAEKRCKELEEYAYCNHEHMDDKEYCDKENNVTSSHIDVAFMNKTEINGPQLYMAKWCQKQFENGTCLVFKYQYDNNKLKLAIQKELELPPEANIWIAAGSSIGIVLLIGIITVIIWKILVDMHDRREYLKFKGEASAAGYNVDNPLYKPPGVDFTNPMYDEHH